MDPGRVVMGLLFYPRGGSAYVVRYLSPALARAGWSVSLATGSLGVPGEGTNAATFFEGLDVHSVDSTDAVRSFEAGGDAIAAPEPMHPSYEDRAGVPDVIFSSVDPDLAEHLAAVWEEPFRAAGAEHADLFHLHHLTPQMDLVARLWPEVPRIAHLHGTELKHIEEIEARAELAKMFDESLATMPERAPEIIDSEASRDLDDTQLDLLRTTRWSWWRRGEFWSNHLRRLAQRADHLITVSAGDRDTAIKMFGVPPEQVTAIANGVDLEQFATGRAARGRRAAFQQWLVDDPQGWSETTPPGSVGYSEADLDRLVGADDGATVLLYVGRFTAAKRVPTLIRAFARARERFVHPGSLVIWGGHPGEWEGEHPVAVAEQVGADGIFFAGWWGHAELPSGLAASDVLVMASVDDSFPQTPLEAMAAGLPVIACRSGGLPSIVNVDPTRLTGWLVTPDDVDALAEAIVAVVNDPAETRARGANALAHAQANLSWDGLVSRFEAVYAMGIERHRERKREGSE